MTTPLIHSFPPIDNPDATVLILGSMPGVASLTAQQYYAHPRNAFWPIMQALFAIDAAQAYTLRVQALQNTPVAVWDVLQQCERKGSLDSAIKAESRIPNDFASFFQSHPHIQCIAFNGGEAEKSFKQYVRNTLDIHHIKLTRLPSTSPAHTMALDDKINAWRQTLSQY